MKALSPMLSPKSEITGMVQNVQNIVRVPAATANPVAEVVLSENFFCCFW